jgi:N-acetylneuraminate lyase
VVHSDDRAYDDGEEVADMIDSLPTGLIAAVPTPFDERGDLDLDRVGPLVDHLDDHSIGSVFVGGTTGEFASLTVNERKQVAEAYLAACEGRMAAFVHAGHECLRDAAELARHAMGSGATAVAAAPPVYFRVRDEQAAVECLKPVAEMSGDAPVLYYHIPRRTGAVLQMPRLVDLAMDQIENFGGVKFSDPSLDQFALTLEAGRGRIRIYYGLDEMLLPAITAGATGAIGGTYSFTGPIFQRVWAHSERGRVEDARLWQLRGCEVVQALRDFGVVPAIKAVLAEAGLDTGCCRLPLRGLVQADRRQLAERLRRMGIQQWLSRH